METLWARIKSLMSNISNLITIVTFLISTFGVIWAYIIENKFIACLLGIIPIFLCIFYIFRRFAFHRGVFAVSAIIINEKHEILLIKDEKNNLKKQPGGHYRTNKFAFRKELDIPYNFILENIKEETGINSYNLEVISFDNILTKECKLDAIEPKFYDATGLYKENLLSPAPCYILKESSKKKKTSGEYFHIDLFYAFKYNGKIKEIRNDLEFVSLDRISQDKRIHQDLAIVGKQIVSQYKKMKYPSSNIRLCTFSNKQSKKLVWRLTETCNAKCRYCISKSSPSNEMVDLSEETINSSLEKIINGKYEKVILTGGEPLLLKETLMQIVKELSESAFDCKEISICTNALHWDNEFIEELCKCSKLNKFVVSVDSFNESKFCRIKGLKSQNNNLIKINRFIDLVKSKNIKVTVNVVASKELLSEPKKYVDYWRKNEYNDISISFPVYFEPPFTRHHLLKIYNQIINGEYGDMSFCKNLELILPDCEQSKCNPPITIHSINKGDFMERCIDIGGH